MLRIEVSSTSLALALLRRLPPERVEGFVIQASEKAAQEQTSILRMSSRHVVRYVLPGFRLSSYIRGSSY